MTSEVKAEVELLIDTIQDQASALDDYLTDEVNELSEEEDRETVVQLAFNINTFRTAIRQMERAKATLQKLIDKN